MATALKTVGGEVDYTQLPVVPGYPNYCYDLGWNVYRRTPAPSTYVGRKCGQWFNGEGRAVWTLYGTDGRAHVVFRSAVVCTHFHGSRPEGMFALHNDGDPANDSEDNLRWGTHTENMADKKRHGTEPDYRGERHPGAKLTEVDVRYIRSSSARHCDLARELGVKPATVEHVRKRIIWKDVA